MKNDPLIHIQFSPDRSLQEQIREHLIASIKQGMFEEKALPSCRKMASMLRVSRNTVVLVYDRLVDEGYLYAQERSGYFPTEKARSFSEKSPAEQRAELREEAAKPALFWRRQTEV